MVGLIPSQHSNSGLTPRDRPAIYCRCVGLVQQPEPHICPYRGPLVICLSCTPSTCWYMQPRPDSAAALVCSSVDRKPLFLASLIGEQRPVMPGTPQLAREIVVVVFVPTAWIFCLVAAFSLAPPLRPRYSAQNEICIQIMDSWGSQGTSRWSNIYPDGMLGLCRETTTLTSAGYPSQRCNVPRPRSCRPSREPAKKSAGFRFLLDVSMTCSHPSALAPRPSPSPDHRTAP